MREAAAQRGASCSGGEAERQQQQGAVVAAGCAHRDQRSLGARG
jgi:hypothetical protein